MHQPDYGEFDYDDHVNADHHHCDFEGNEMTDDNNALITIQDDSFHPTTIKVSLV